MSITIIINPIAGGYVGSVGARVDLARRVASECGQTADVSITERRGHARALVEAARASGATRVVAWGGDGTINEVASILAFGDLAMGIVPGGSGNGLARELALPVRAEEALRTAIQGAPRPIDVGQVDDRLFVNLAGIGFDAAVAAAFNAPGNRRRGAREYVRLTATSLFTYRARRYTIVADGARSDVHALLIVVANGTEFGNRILIAPGADVSDGVLDLVVVKEQSRLGTMCRVPWLLARRIDRCSSVWSSRPARDVTIDTDQPMPFHVDGESVQGGTTIRARIHPGALNVVTGA